MPRPGPPTAGVRRATTVAAALVLGMLAGPAAAQPAGRAPHLLGAVGALAAPARPAVQAIGATADRTLALPGAVLAAPGQAVPAVAGAVSGALQDVTGVAGTILPRVQPVTQAAVPPLTGLVQGTGARLAPPAPPLGQPSPGIVSGNAAVLLLAPSAPTARSSISPPAVALGDQPGLLTPSLAPAVPEAASAARLADLARRNPRLLETDGQGRAVVRGEVLAVSPNPAALAAAQRLGFTVGRRAALPGLDGEMVVLQVPRGMTAAQALAQLRALDPEGAYDANHIYAEAGSVGGRAAGGARAPVRTSGRVGLIDQGADLRHPALRGLRVEQKAFGPGGLAPGPHGLATASLLAGRDGGFRGAAPGAGLYLADVYGPTAAGGSAAALVRALAWMAQVRAPVINISLVGPPNAAVKAAVAALVARGHILVAAAGNDGPAAPPLYPAAYPGVLAVTAVDARSRALPEAAQGPQVDFAARGADMAAAGAGGYVAVRGTSFAAPLVAGSLAERLKAPDAAAAQAAVAALQGGALDLGAPGVDPVYGRGLVAADAWVSPAAVAARGLIASR